MTARVYVNLLDGKCYHNVTYIDPMGMAVLDV
jgi:hypothetical protein